VYGLAWLPECLLAQDAVSLLSLMAEWKPG
jgi:hypothetical protein